MANYLYNGVELPDINTVWTDKTTYPYAMIARANSGAYQFRVSTDPFYYEARTAGTSVLEEVGSTGTQLIASMVNSAWGALDPSYGADTVLLYSTPFVWANHDVVYKDSTEVYQEASEPVLVEEPVEPDEPDEPVEPEVWSFDHYSFKVGLSLGLSGKPLPLAKKEPIAYLYNGVQLPKLPEWDRVAYPYAYIGTQLNAGVPWRYWLYVSEIPFFAYGDVVTAPNDTTSAITWFTNDTLGYWKGEKVEEFGATSACYKPMWTNYDFYYKPDAGGGLYLAASEPIPVYE